MDIKSFFKKKKEKTLSEKKQPAQTVVCKNCETTFTGNYCPNCGQSSNDFNLPFRFVIYDFMGTVFAFDTRFFKTIKTLALVPGKFSSDFIEGKRASYSKPFQLYVFISFIFFLLLSLKTNQFINNSSINVGKNEDIVALNDSMVRQAVRNDTLALNNDVNKIMKSNSDLNKSQRDEITTHQFIKKIQNALEKNYNQNNTTGSDKKIIKNLIKQMNYPEMFVSKTLRYFSWSLFFLMPILAFWLWIFFQKQENFTWVI